MTADEARAREIVKAWWISQDGFWPSPEDTSPVALSLRGLVAEFKSALADARRECEQVALRWLAAYPTDIFTEPPPGEHGETVDGCSARAARHVAKGIADEIRELATRRTT